MVYSSVLHEIYDRQSKQEMRIVTFLDKKSPVLYSDSRSFYYR